ncbi:MAG: M23 family metallopeptidase [Rhodospirillaceae bacterium]|nr:M23 family metallopeptidase [Rhodospirillaceae bacterium]
MKAVVDLESQDSYASAMKTRSITLRTTPLIAVLAAMLAVSCAPTNYPEPIVRRPVPTLPDASVQPQDKNTIVVRRGDSLYALARRHGIPIRGLIDANQLRAPYRIHPGQRLKMPRSRYHIVGGGETVYSIARTYKVEMGPLVRINRIPPPYRVAKGQRLRLPDPAKPKYRKVVSVDRSSGRVTSTSKTRRKPPQWISKPRRRSRREPPPAPPKRVKWQNPDATGPLKVPPPRSNRKFLWPLKGKVIVAFGVRKGGLHNDGINIAARKGVAIRAAENGVVAYAGNQLQGFGNLVLIKHSGGWMSAYAHSSVIHVSRGDVVRRGQVIARVGRTGNVSKPQLHFELRKGDRAVNPRRYLVRFAFLMPTAPQWAKLPTLKR